MPKKDVYSASDPVEFVNALSDLAQDCYEADGQLSEAWQQKGTPWAIIAKGLDSLVARLRLKIGG